MYMTRASPSHLTQGHNKCKWDAAAAKSLQSCPTLCDPHPWDSLGKNTGVGCHFLLQCIKVKSESEVAQSCLTLTPWTAAYIANPVKLESKDIRQNKLTWFFSLERHQNLDSWSLIWASCLSTYKWDVFNQKIWEAHRKW